MVTYPHPLQRQQLSSLTVQPMATYPAPQTPGISLSASNYMAAMRQQIVRPDTAVSDYAWKHGKARDHSAGRYIETMLENKGIDIDNPPPLQAIADGSASTSHGVVKINNIPFTVSAQEITQFIARYAPYPMLKKHHEGYPIHIIMEKPTGKTMDCFVEFPSQMAAHACVRSFEYTAAPGRGTKLGTRNVTIDLSSQSDLMHAVFPRARLVEFDPEHGEPRILDVTQDPSWSEGFRGYFTLEEVYGITRFAECPSRSPFVLKCHQRVYESMISTLYKFPWTATQTYTVNARNALFEAAYKQLNVLSRKAGNIQLTQPSSYSADFVRYGSRGNSRAYSSEDDLSPTSTGSTSGINDLREVGLSPQLLMDLLFAALNVPAFTLLQKHALTSAAGSFGRGVHLSPFCETWPFQTLQPSTGTTDAAIQFWLELYDTGFGLTEADGIDTTFEDYIVFHRNRIGFPIAEWTHKGANLPFEDATRIEHAAMMIYVTRGREQWTRERGLKVEQWETQGLLDLLQQITSEKKAGKQICHQSERTSFDYDISPRTSITQSSTQPQPIIGSDVNGITASGDHCQDILRTSKPGSFTATAPEFVPGSAKSVVLTNSDHASSIGGGATLPVRCAPSNQWGDVHPPTGPASMRPGAITRPRLPRLDTSVPGAVPPIYSTDVTFKDPFAPIAKSAAHTQSAFEISLPSPAARANSCYTPGSSFGQGRLYEVLPGIDETGEAMRRVSLATAATVVGPISLNNSTSLSGNSHDIPHTHRRHIGESDFSSVGLISNSMPEDPFVPRPVQSQLQNIVHRVQAFPTNLKDTVPDDPISGTDPHELGPIGSASRNKSTATTTTRNAMYNHEAAMKGRAKSTPLTSFVKYSGIGLGDVQQADQGHDECFGKERRGTIAKEIWGGMGAGVGAGRR